MARRDFLFSRQQRNPADLLEIQADGVVDVDQVQIDIQLGNLHTRIFTGVLNFLLLVKRPDLDALLEQIREQIFELLHVGFSFGKCVQHIIVCHEPLVAPKNHQLLGGFRRTMGADLLLIFFRQEFLVI